MGIAGINYDNVVCKALGIESRGSCLLGILPTELLTSLVPVGILEQALAFIQLCSLVFLKNTVDMILFSQKKYRMPPLLLPFFIIPVKKETLHRCLKRYHYL